MQAHLGSYKQMNSSQQLESACTQHCVYSLLSSAYMSQLLNPSKIQLRRCNQVHQIPLKYSCLECARTTVWDVHQADMNKTVPHLY